MEDISIDGCDYFTANVCKSEGCKTSPLNSFTKSQSLKVQHWKIKIDPV